MSKLLETKSFSSCFTCIPKVISQVSTCTSQCGNPLKNPQCFFQCMISVGGSCLGCVCEAVCLLFPEICELCPLGVGKNFLLNLFWVEALLKIFFLANIETPDCALCVDGVCVTNPGQSCPTTLGTGKKDFFPTILKMLLLRS